VSQLWQKAQVYEAHAHGDAEIARIIVINRQYGLETFSWEVLLKRYQESLVTLLQGQCKN